MTFPDPQVRNFLKDSRIYGESLLYVIAETKPFLLILGHAVTVYKYQVSSRAYMQGDLNGSTGKKTATGKNYQQLISQGQFYTLLSCAKSGHKILFVNFEPEDIKVNESALEIMVQARKEPLFSWQHPLVELNGTT